MDADRDHLGRKLSNLELCALWQRIIVLSCPKCRRARRLDAVTLWWLFERNRWSDEIGDVSRRFWCGQCGQRPKRRPIVKVTEGQPEGEQWPYPDEREWKRLQSRYRS